MTELHPRDKLLAWRNGDSSHTAWVVRELRWGHLDVWLDPNLSLYALAEPELYAPALEEGTLLAGRNVAKGLHLRERDLVRAEDSFALLRTELIRAWARAEDLWSVSLCLFPWDDLFTIDDEDAPGIIAPTGQSTMLKTDSIEFREYTRLVLDVTRELKVVWEPANPALHSAAARTRIFFQKLEAWDADPERSWHSMFHDVPTTRDSKYLDPVSAYLTGNDDVFDQLRGWTSLSDKEADDVLATKVRQLKLRYPVNPLIQHLPEKDIAPYSLYATMKSPTLFTYRQDIP